MLKISVDPSLCLDLDCNCPQQRVVGCMCFELIQCFLCTTTIVANINIRFSIEEGHIIKLNVYYILHTHKDDNSQQWMV